MFFLWKIIEFLQIQLAAELPGCRDEKQARLHKPSNNDENIISVIVVVW